MIAEKSAKKQAAARNVARAGRRAPRSMQVDIAARSESAPSGKLQYVYCIIRDGPRLALSDLRIGIGDEPAVIRTIAYKGLAAVISDAPAGGVPASRNNVLAHERVNERIMEVQTVVPMAFGMVFRSSADIGMLLRSAHDTFSSALESVEGKVEIGLQVLWEPERVHESLRREHEPLSRAFDAIAAGKATSMAARIEYGQLVASLEKQRADAYSQEILDALGSVSVAAKCHEPTSNAMMLNAAFLTVRDRRRRFDRRLKCIDARHPDLIFRVTGPWPPYSFVTIRLKVENPGGPEEGAREGAEEA